MSVLKISNLYFKYPSSASWIFENLSLDLSAGESCLIVGDNGSGKTSLGKILAGLFNPQHGTIQIDNLSVEAVDVVRRPQLVIYTGQVSYLQFFQPTISDEIKLAIKMARVNPQNLDEIYNYFNLPKDRQMRPMDLSYPAMWRLQLLLLSVVFNPSVLFIDEIVAPNARSQTESLKAVLRDRSNRGQITIIAYQRMLVLPVGRNLQLREGRIYAI